MRISEIFTSLQGESTYAGLPCTLVRLSGCPLRCSYCDTAYAFSDGTEMTLQEVMGVVDQARVRLVEITGGEPLAQESVYPLMGALLDKGYQVLLETSGTLDVSRVDTRVVKIMDLKCPGSGEASHNCYENLNHLTPEDQVKFVVGNQEDYLWARDVIERFRLPDRVEVLIVPVYGKMNLRDLADWILEDRLTVRLGLQVHKLIWGEGRGR